MRYEQDPGDFLREIEERRGGKIGWRTFSTWFSDGTNIREYGVFIYEVGQTIYYEDFERRRNILGFELPKRKGEPPYVKLEGSFKAAEVGRITTVVRRRAERYLCDPSKTALLREAGLFARVFFRLLTMVELEDGRRLFFEFLDRKRLQAIVSEAGGGRG